MNRFALSLKSALLFATFAAASLAHAATCTVSAGSVAFGAYVPNQALPADSAGNVTVNCSKGLLDILPLTVSYTIELSKGSGPTFGSREMKSGGNALGYNLYRDLLRTSVWGDGSGGSSTLSATLILPLILGSANNLHPVYGRVAGNQNAVPGAYSDVITVTVTY